MQRSRLLRNISPENHKLELIFSNPILELNSLENNERNQKCAFILWSSWSIYSVSSVYKCIFSATPLTQLYKIFKHLWPPFKKEINFLNDSDCALEKWVSSVTFTWSFFFWYKNRMVLTIELICSWLDRQSENKWIIWFIYFYNYFFGR